MRMLSDHTEGTAAGRPTPFAHVADNDLAVGKLVEHISLLHGTYDRTDPGSSPDDAIRCGGTDVNPGGTGLAAMAKGLNLSEVDRVPDEIMNAMVWKAVKGENAIVPAPVRTAFVKEVRKTGEDD
jgi:hypothetical protein